MGNQKEMFDKLFHAIQRMDANVDGLSNRLDGHIKEMNEFRKEANEHFDTLEQDVKEIRENQGILIKENWSNKKDMNRIKKKLGMEIF